MDDVLSGEGLISHKILHELGLDVQLLYGFIRVHIARRFDGHNVRALCEDLQESNRGSQGRQDRFTIWQKFLILPQSCPVVGRVVHLLYTHTHS